MIIGGVIGAIGVGAAHYVGGKAMTEMATNASNTFKRAFGMMIEISPKE